MARARRAAGRGRAVLVPVLALLLALPAAPAAADRFVIQDALSEQQLTERIAVIIDGREVGVFHLDATHPADTLAVTVPDAPVHEYLLCGETLLRRAEGGSENRPVNDSGTLADANGRTYLAYTEGFLTFFLVDATPARPPAELRTRLGPRCPAAISQAPVRQAPVRQAPVLQAPHAPPDLPVAPG